MGKPKPLTTTPDDFCQVRHGPSVIDTYLVDVLLLCAECGESIKGRINTQQWIRVEFIGPEGECLKCYQEKKANRQ